MEAALVSAATGALKPVMKKLAALMGDEYTCLKEVRHDIRFLTDELAGMHVFLLRMSEEEEPDAQDKVWMTAVRELSYDLMILCKVSATRMQNQMALWRRSRTQWGSWES